MAWMQNNEVYNRLLESISDELIDLLEGNYMDDKHEKLRKRYILGSDYKKGVSVNEALYKMAVIQGIDKSFPKENHPIKQIWCGKKEHKTIKRIKTKNAEYQSKIRSERMAKNPDIAWRTGAGDKPDWFCQVKILTHGEGSVHKKSAQALGDFFWAAIDRKYLDVFSHRHAEFIFVWIEDKSSKKKDVGKFLQFNKDSGEMQLKLAPGYHKDVPGTPEEGFGELRFQTLNERNQDGSVNVESGPWTNKSTCVVTPNNRTAIKEILAAGTNGTFFRMFNQPGALFINSRFKQFHTEKWGIYIHRLMPNTPTLRGATSVGESPFGGGKLFNWIP